MAISTESAAPAALPSVGIVILNWNNLEASTRCLRSLAALTYPRHRVYLLDNASTDGSWEALEREFRNQVVTISNPGNVGFSAGCNPGIRRALADGCDYVLLLNNDCIVVDPGFLESMVTLAESDPSIGLVGGKIVLWPETSRLWSTGGTLDFWGAERHTGHRETDLGQYDEVAPREFISGALMLIRRSVVERIGELPEAYFFGKEEWEYSTRARRAGFRLCYQPAARIAHEASNSTDPTNLMYVYNGTLCKILYKRRNLPRWAFALWDACYAAYLFALFPIKHALHRGDYLQGHAPKELRRVMCEAWRDSRGLEKVTAGHLAAFRERERQRSAEDQR
jgi:GT2 family glycosyltransferase